METMLLAAAAIFLNVGAWFWILRVRARTAATRIQELEERAAKLEKQIADEKSAATVLLARRVAHDILSPATAIELVLPQLENIPEPLHRTLAASVKEIKHLVNKLRTAPEAILESRQRIPLAATIDAIVGEKRVNLSDRQGIRLTFANEPGTSDATAAAERENVRTALSAVIDNAVEAYGAQGGTVGIRLSVVDGTPLVKVTDTGCGMPMDVLGLLGRRPVSLKGAGRGQGLLSAVRAVESWKGAIRFDSEPGRGTTVTLQM